ncbi:hypothetical protein HYQ46_003968 [Verticillium longisporum]|nr:hypothetical protein HYQ46_003968 [Verticillium longisporum]
MKSAHNVRIQFDFGEVDHVPPISSHLPIGLKAGMACAATAMGSSDLHRIAGGNILVWWTRASYCVFVEGSFWPLGHNLIDASPCVISGTQVYRTLQRLPDEILLRIFTCKQATFIPSRLKSLG